MLSISPKSVMRKVHPNGQFFPPETKISKLTKFPLDGSGNEPQDHPAFIQMGKYKIFHSFILTINAEETVQW